MRLKIQPENILEAIFLKTKKIPEPFILSLLGMGVSQVLFTAMRLRVFDRLQNNPKTALELASEMECDFHGMKVLLESLDGFGFLRSKDGKYQLTKESERWLVGEGNIVQDFMRLGGDINAQMALLEKDIRTGVVPNFHFDPQSPTCEVNYFTMLKSSANMSAPKLLKWAKLEPVPKRLLDVAGGPGLYSIALCQKYPDLKADILDLPAAAKAGKKPIEKADLTQRIRYIEANLLETDWEQDYDLVLLSNILHALTESQCKIAIQKSFACLNKGGKIIINDVFHPGDRGKLDSFISLFSLIYYVTCGGRTWPKPKLLEWLTKEGFTNIKVKRNGSGIWISAEKNS
ncbi:MAG: class I SAM-dependent methyltransferase [Cyanobacteria bacterium P01_H01_bin.35]